MKGVFLAVILTMVMSGCSPERMNDPVGTEVILIPGIEDTLGDDPYNPYHEFTDRDGYKSIGFETPWYIGRN